MNVEFVKNHFMANNLETHWMPIVMKTMLDKNSTKATSLQIFWDKANGIMNGFINIYITNDFQSKTLLVTYNVNSISNKSNSILLELNPVYSFIKLEYSKNQIVDGLLNATLNYIEV